MTPDQESLVEKMVQLHAHVVVLRDLILAAALSDVSLDVDNLRHLLGRSISDADDLAGLLIPDMGQP